MEVVVLDQGKPVGLVVLVVAVAMGLAQEALVMLVATIQPKEVMAEQAALNLKRTVLVVAVARLLPEKLVQQQKAEMAVMGQRLQFLALLLLMLVAAEAGIKLIPSQQLLAEQAVVAGVMEHLAYRKMEQPIPAAVVVEQLLMLSLGKSELQAAAASSSSRLDNKVRHE